MTGDPTMRGHQQASHQEQTSNGEKTNMNRRSAIALLLTGFAALSYAPQASSETGWVTLFDGKNLDNFDKIGDANWRLEDGVVVADKGNGFLVTKSAYADYQIRAEFWVDADANSGIFIRCTDPQKVGADNAYEVNIWDTRPDPSYGTGAIVNLGKVDPMPRAGGKWNVFEITAKGSTFTVVLNGIGRQGRQGRRQRQGRGQVPQGGNQAAITFISQQRNFPRAPLGCARETEDGPWAARPTTAADFVPRAMAVAGRVDAVLRNGSAWEAPAAGVRVESSIFWRYALHRAMPPIFDQSHQLSARAVENT
jgi:hypothetical protein